MTPVKYECDSNNRTGTFARSKILFTEKLINGSLVTPTPGLLRMPVINWANIMTAGANILACLYCWWCYIMMTSISTWKIRQFLTHWGWVTHICVSKLPTIDWTLMNKFQWNFNQNSNIFIQENVFERVVCEMAAMLSGSQCVNSLWLRDAIWHQRPLLPLPKPMILIVNWTR